MNANPIERLRLRTIISALKLEQKGMRRSRSPSALAIAKLTTGLTTNDRAKQIEKLEEMSKEGVVEEIVLSSVSQKHWGIP